MQMRIAKLPKLFENSNYETRAGSATGKTFLNSVLSRDYAFSSIVFPFKTINIFKTLKIV